MLKKFKNPLAMLLAVLIAVTAIVPAYSRLFALAEEDEIVTTILDFETTEQYRYGYDGYFGADNRFGDQNTTTTNLYSIYWTGDVLYANNKDATSGSRSFETKWSAGANWGRAFAISAPKDTVYNMSDADAIAFDFYVSDIEKWKAGYAKKWGGNIASASILLRSKNYVNSANMKAIGYYELPADLKEGWNTIVIDFDNFKSNDLDLSQIVDIQFRPAMTWAVWTPSDSGTKLPEGFSDINITLRIDNIRKIKNPRDRIAPTTSATKIEMSGVAGTFVTAKIGQFSDNYTDSDKIVYTLYASETPINEDNVESCTLKTEDVMGATAKLTGLNVDTDYYFAVKATDAVGNFAYLFNADTIKTKSSDKDVTVSIIDFEDGENYTFGPNFVPGHMGTVTTEKTSGARSFRRDWGYRDPYNNFITFSSATGTYFDLSDGDVLAIDLYIDNIENWNLVYNGKAGIELRANRTSATYKHITIPKGLKQGWNTIEINIDALAGLELDKITDIKITPVKLGWWGNEGGKPTIPSGYENTVADISLRIDNIRVIIDPIDRTAPIYDNTDIVANAISGSHITVEFPQFTDNVSANENLTYTVYASKTPLDVSNVEACTNKTTVTGILLATLKDLTADTDYYLGVKCTDEAGNSGYVFAEKAIHTSEIADYFCAPIFSCETLPTETYGPSYTYHKGYNSEIKTEGKASLIGTLTNRPHYENLLVAYRKNNPIDISKCNVLSLDFYVGDIDVYNTYWKDNVYILLTNEKKGVNSGTTNSYIALELPELVEGWNSLQYPLNHSIDLSTVWAMRISTHKQWQNDSGHNPGTADAALSVGIDNVRGEYLPLEMDDRNPTINGNYLKADHISNSSVSILHSLASDNITNEDNMVYEIIASEKKITPENVKSVSGVKVKSTGRFGEVTGLKANTEYYFAVCPIDEAGNKGDYIIGEEAYKTYSDAKDHWYMLSDCDKESGVTIYPDNWVSRVPSFTSDPVAQGTTSITKTLDNNSYVWHNLVTLNSGVKKDIAYATRVDFKLYIDSLEKYENYWYGRLYFVITDGYGQYAAFAMPKELKEGWNDVSISLYGKDIDLTNISGLRVTPVGSNSNDGSTVIKGVEEGVDVKLKVAIDYITAVYDASLLPTLAPSDDEATYITNCDALDEGGYWNTGVSLDEFEKTEGAASIKKTFGSGFVKENAFTYVALEPINMSGADALHFDLYVSNVALLKNRTEMIVKLGSSQKAEGQYIAFKLPVDDLQTGWNSVQLELDSAFDTRADFDIENLVLFTLYCEKSIFLKGESIDLRIDNIRMTGDIGGDYETETEPEPEIEYVEEIITETIYESQVVHKTEYQKAEPINTISVKTYTHNKGYPVYVWILAIAVPAACICGLAAFFIVGRIVKKRRK